MPPATILNYRMDMSEKLDVIQHTGRYKGSMPYLLDEAAVNAVHFAIDKIRSVLQAWANNFRILSG